MVQLKNTDRHWGNRGFLVDNRTNLPAKLHPLMDFNKAFLAYDTLEGGRCLTTDTDPQHPISQMDAAICGVEAVGLNRISEIREEWFEDEEKRDMFSRRLGVLEERK